MSDEAEGAKQTLIRGMLEWWKGQPFANSMAFLQLLAMGGAVYLAVYVLIPAERQAIQDMIRHVEEQQTQQIDRLSDSFDRALDRIASTGRISSGATVSAKKTQNAGTE